MSLKFRYSVGSRSLQLAEQQTTNTKQFDKRTIDRHVLRPRDEV